MFRKSLDKDLEVIIQIIRQAQDYFKKEGIPQWQDGYPNKNSIQEDIDKGHSYVLECRGNVLGTTALIFGEEATYEKIYDGNWLTDASLYGTIHRIAIDREEKGKGYASRIIEECIGESKKQNIGSIRVDTHRLNLPMQGLLKKHGFKYCGIIYLKDGAERLAFEKIL